ncbi:GNAT family N-acetyltransferase [Hyphococcus sp.]|jgi:RimJ/RimL family protein N-acetyltransferase|uniref:GNAT family N-acetyltransferase n=1 Tax=Hyphococcus sp. TaxID=2038636 RepID=UPI003D0D75E9
MTVIHTKRLLLRRIEAADAPDFARLCNDELIARNTARIPHPYTLQDAEGFVAFIGGVFDSGAEYAFAVCEAGELVACCGVTGPEGNFDLGYWVGAPFRGRGVATEAARAVAHFAFEKLGADILQAAHFTDNPASGRVLEKAGFRYTGESRKQFSLGRGHEADSFRMTLAHADFAPPEGVRVA